MTDSTPAAAAFDSCYLCLAPVEKCGALCDSCRAKAAAAKAERARHFRKWNLSQRMRRG